MVYVILLNWNGWKYTLHCLESVFRSDYPDFQVIVCDNQSMDGSLEKIKAWADGKLAVEEKLNDKLNPLIFPEVEKPIPYIEYQRVEAEAGGEKYNKDIPLVLIQNGSNDGYSAGNNVGIRYALKKNPDYIWLLNNDTVVKSNTLKELVSHVQSEENIGIAGTVIYFASDPSKIQTYGGGKIAPLIGLDSFILSPDSIDYVSGTSLFIKREVIEQIGLLDEEFFFYWEDVDFSQRALKRGWKLGVAANAIVYHKFSTSVKGQSLKSDLFKVDSLIRYFKKHKKVSWIFPVVFNISGMVVNRLLRKQFDRIKLIVKESWKTMIH